MTLAWEKWYPILLKEWKSFLDKAPDVSPIHRTDHVLRVWKRSKILCEKMGGDLEVMVAVVMLHDLARHHGLEIHGKESAEMAKPVLERIGFPNEKIGSVLDAIAAHDYTTPGSERKSLESRILYDIDKIDAFGAVGILRHIIYYYEKKGLSIDEILKMLEKRWNGIVLGESRELAKRDYDYIYDFFVRLKEEVEVEG